MPTYKVTDPVSGRTVRLTGDSPPSADVLNKVFSTLPPKEQPSMISKAWDALAVPEKMSREGLQMISQAIPEAPGIPTQGLPFPMNAISGAIGDRALQTPGLTGNRAADMIKGTPKIAAETLGETAPGFISRAQLLMMGALKGAKLAAPLMKMAGRGIATGAEALSGLEHKTPGVLMEAAENPKLLFSPGRKAASAVYQASKETGGQIRPELLKIPGKMDFIGKASDLADEGNLTPSEALEARKELDAVKKKVTGEFFRTARGKFDAIAKADENIKMADPIYAKGIKAEALRSVLPLNKTGGASTFKTMVGGALGGVPLAVMSPLVQGTAATGAGIAARAAAPLVNNPVTTAGMIQAGKIATDQFKLKPDVAALSRGEKKEAKPSELESKILTKDKAYEYFKQAMKENPKDSKEKNKKRARRMAKDDGYTWEGDF